MHKQTFIVAIGSLAMFALAGNPMMAEKANPRFGRWKLKSNAPPPSSNIMIYAPLGKHGMKITIDSVNRNGDKSEWGYTTNFDGKDEPLTGNKNMDTGSVKVLNQAVNEIVYKKDGRVTEILTNVLSPDANTIGVMYMHQNAEGKTTNVSFATYERIP